MEPVFTNTHAFHFNSDRIRGTVINLTVHMERVMDNYICKYFCSDTAKRMELIELLIADRMDFSKKAEAYVQILKKKCEVEKKDFNVTFPGLGKQLQEIAETRNIFAHTMSYPTPSEEDMSKYAVVLVKYKNKTNFLRYTQSDVDVIIQRLRKAVNTMDVLNGDK